MQNGQIIIYSALNYGIKSYDIEINGNLIFEAKEKLKILKREKKNYLEIYIEFHDITYFNSSGVLIFGSENAHFPLIPVSFALRSK